MKRTLLSVLTTLTALTALAQDGDKTSPLDKGQLSGNFQTNNQFYLRDDRIGANTTQYLYQKSSTDAWLFLNYKTNGFNVAFRFDVFNNTPLFNPQQAYTKSGIGFWQISKDVQKFNITAGYFYEQFGSGMSFRAYEDRNLGIDFAILGGRLIYRPTENTQIKAFTGQQKYRFDVRESIIKGLNAEHRFVISDEVSNEVGGAIVNRTLDNTTMSSLVTTINTYPIEERFDPKYNAYVFQAYNTFNYRNYSLMLEYNYKTPEAIMNAQNKLINSEGNIYFASLSYSGKGLGMNAQFKRIESFPFKTSPLETSPPPNNAPVNYLPSITRQNTYRLLARYNSVVQELGENAMQVEGAIKLNKKIQFGFNLSAVVTLDGLSFSKLDFTWNDQTKLFREIYGDFQYKVNKSFKFLLGVQSIGYNQTVYEAKANAPYVTTITPFGEMTYKLSPTHSIRFEAQYMHTEQDLGSFVNGIVEYNMAPHWSLGAGDLLNFKHGSLNEPAPGESFEYIHYYNFYAALTVKTTRVTAAFMKQPQGVNCTGGVCRVEPAFSGLRVTLLTNF